MHGGVERLCAGHTTQIERKLRDLPTEFLHQTFGFGWVEANVERMHLSGSDLGNE
jgi:hypothetical protein